MTMHNHRAFAIAREVDILFGNARPARQRTVNYEYFLEINPSRKITHTTSDVMMVAVGWVLLIGVINNPVAHLIGLAVCGIALLWSSIKLSPSAFHKSED